MKVGAPEIDLAELQAALEDLLAENEKLNGLLSERSSELEKVNADMKAAETSAAKYVEALQTTVAELEAAAKPAADK